MHFRYLGHVTQAWDHTASLQATIYSVAGGKSVAPTTLHPYRQHHQANRQPVTKHEAKQTAKDLHMLIRARGPQ